MQAQTPPLQRLLLTGAAGGLGQVLRQRLRGLAPVLRVSDIAGMGAPLDAQEEVNTCDLADKQAVDAMVAGCDAIVHLGGVSVERPFEEVLEANIKGIFHLYEAARRHAVKRIVFASSNHVIGFYQQSEKIVGASLLGFGCDEVVQVISNFMATGASYQVLRDALPIHPTVAEFLPFLLDKVELLK